MLVSWMAAYGSISGHIGVRGNETDDSLTSRSHFTGILRTGRVKIIERLMTVCWWMKQQWRLQEWGTEYGMSGNDHRKGRAQRVSLQPAQPTVCDCQLIVCNKQMDPLSLFILSEKDRAPPTTTSQLSYFTSRPCQHLTPFYVSFHSRLESMW